MPQSDGHNMHLLSEVKGAGQWGSGAEGVSEGDRGGGEICVIGLVTCCD